MSKIIELNAWRSRAAGPAPEPPTPVYPWSGCETAAPPTIMPTVVSWVDSCIAEWTRLKSRKPGTLKGLRNAREHFVRWFPEMPIDQLQQRHVQAWVTWLRTEAKQKNGKPWSKNSIRCYHGHLSTCLTEAVDLGLLESNPCKGLSPKVLPARTPEVDYKVELLPVPDFLRLTFGGFPLEHRSLIAFLGMSGARIEEALALMWSDWLEDLEPLGRIRICRQFFRGELITTKAGDRDVPVHPQLAELLRAWRVHSPFRDRSPFVWPRRDGTSGSYSTWRYRWMRDLSRLSLPHRRIHSLRHWFTTRMREAGAAREVVSACTHRETRRGMQKVYDHSEIPWDVMCTEITKLKLEPPAPAQLALPLEHPKEK